MWKNVYNYYQSYAFVVATILAYVTVRFVLDLSDYFAIVIANVCCLAFLQIFNFKEDLRLEGLRTKQAEVSSKPEKVILNIAALYSRSKDNAAMTFELAPNYFFGFDTFNKGFSLKYVAEDTDKFISTFSERLKIQLYSNFAIMLTIIVFLKPSVETSATVLDLFNDPKELTKVAITISGTIINLLILGRPYLHCRERNKTLLNN